ncbi:hypothetical protein [Aureivirga sp. CE67]|uniref:hypothetical protein n=1 Tax=Aureivirga sp. CE67 TaxID=1788983 RepID=UPI0018C9A397|nr:hypothetical protein [Aureivirga sp. CE67]
MKKLIAIIVLLVTVTVSAQDKKPHHKHKKADFTPEQQAIIKTKKMTLALDLNKSQQDKILKINTDLAHERAENKAKWKENKAKGIKLTDDQKFELINTKLDKQIAIQNEMKDILSQEQFEQWKKVKKKMFKERKHKAAKIKKHKKMEKIRKHKKAEKLRPATPVEK